MHANHFSQPFTMPETHQADGIEKTLDAIDDYLTLDHFSDQTGYFPKEQLQHFDTITTKNMHAGQLKLLMSELYPMSVYDKDYDTVIYAGSAPGTHIVYLAQHFPDKHFHLYDIQAFDPRLSGFSNVTIHNSLLDANSIERIIKITRNARIFFISDIRNRNIASAKQGHFHSEQHKLMAMDKVVQEDMKLQQQLYYDLQPSLSLLKFRLPWVLEPYSTYLDGKIYLQTYAKYASNETRLLVYGPHAKQKQYDNKRYKEQMHHFNYYDRAHDNFDQHSFHYILDTYKHCRKGNTCSTESIIEDIVQVLYKSKKKYALLNI